jgi:RNase P subunit RPR2
LVSNLLISLKRHILARSHSLRQRLLQWTSPLSRSLLGGTLSDLARPKAELIAENALLRQQLIILQRQVKRPTCTKTDRFLIPYTCSKPFRHRACTQVLWVRWKDCQSKPNRFPQLD